MNESGKNMDTMFQAWKNWVKTTSDENLRNIYENLQNPDRRTSLENLARRYKRFGIVGLLMVPVSLCYLHTGIFAEPYNVIISVSLMVYFAICAAMDFWLFRGITGIDIYRESVSEVSRKVRYYRRKHLQFITVLVPLMIAVLTVMFISQFDNITVLTGLIAGALVGLVIGLTMLSKFLAEYNILLNP